MQDGFLYPLMSFFGVILVIFLAYFGTKYISMHYAKMSSGRHIKVLERASLGQDKSLVLVTVHEKAYVLGVTGKGIQVVCEFDENEIIQETECPKKEFTSFLSESFKKHTLFNRPYHLSRNLPFNLPFNLHFNLPDRLSMNEPEKKDKNGCGKE